MRINDDFHFKDTYEEYKTDKRLVMMNNIQTNDIQDGETQFNTANKVVASLNSVIMSGFKTGESNIENLITPLYTQYFEVLQPTES